MTDTPPGYEHLRMSEAQQAEYLTQAYTLARDQMPWNGEFYLRAADLQRKRGAAHRVPSIGDRSDASDRTPRAAY